MSFVNLAPALPGLTVLKAPELTVVVPTFNEAPNIPILVNRLTEVLIGIEWKSSS